MIAMNLQLSTSRMRVDRAGFTLFEILIVVTFAGLLAAVTFPRIADLQSRFAVGGAVMRGSLVLVREH